MTKFSQVWARASENLLVCSLLVCVLCGLARPVLADQPLVVGYLPEYRVATMKVTKLPAITDLVYFGVELQANGQMPQRPISARTLDRLNAIRQATNCRLLLCVGGWNRSQGFARLARDAAARKRFVLDLRELCRRHKFDGVDYDWEHPRGEEELGGYAKLIAETRANFHTDRRIVTVAQASWQDLGHAVYRNVDRVHLMSYDHKFPQATISKSQEDVTRLLKWKCPPQKLVLGIPFYGRNAAGEARTYGELVEGKSVPASQDQVDGFAFNNRRTLVAKLDLIKEHSLAGVMVWEVGQDSVSPHLSLLSEIHRAQLSGTDRQKNGKVEK